MFVAGKNVLARNKTVLTTGNSKTIIRQCVKLNGTPRFVFFFDAKKKWQFYLHKIKITYS